MSHYKICVLGCTGMLGNAVMTEMVEHYGKEHVVGTFRPNADYKCSIALPDHWNVVDFDAVHYREVPSADYIINCIGVIKPFIKDNVQNSIKINALFPHQLATWANFYKYKVIHITTDCVFSGKNGPYDENALHDAPDDYGKSKSLGEPDNCMVLRTSIIGEELHKFASLISWAKSQKDKEVNGFTNHIWSGITTKQYGKVVAEIIDRDLYDTQKYHIFSSVVTKAQLLHMLNKRFDLNLTIKEVKAPESIDRSLITVKGLCYRLSMPSLGQQLWEL